MLFLRHFLHPPQMITGADTGFYLTTAKKKKKKKEGVTIIYAHNAYGVIFPVPDTYAAETFQALPFTEEF